MLAIYSIGAYNKLIKLNKEANLILQGRVKFPTGGDSPRLH